MQSRFLSIGLIILVALFVVSAGARLLRGTAQSQPVLKNSPVDSSIEIQITDGVKHSIPLNKILDGGPGKDGIPALHNPKFTGITDAKFGDEVLGMFIAMGGEQRWYPYSILVWHEIVNDQIGETKFAVTFCPLCGSAIVFNRSVGSTVLDFGVSGKLFESNLLMYDKQTNSLWSQARGEAVVGDYTTTKLEILPMQLITFKELKEKYPHSKVMSMDTGYKRDYSFYPYGSYNESDDLYFPVSVQDQRFKRKEVMYVIPFGERSIAFPSRELIANKPVTFTVDAATLTATRNGGEIHVVSSKKELPGYYEMWFSWATQHQKNGIVWQLPVKNN